METLYYVVKRDGRQQAFDRKKITTRLETLMDIEPKIVLDKEPIKVPPHVSRNGVLDISPEGISTRVFRELYNGITTSEVDELVAQTCAVHTTIEPQMELLAGRVSVSNLMKSLPEKFSEAVKKCQNFRHKEGFIHSLYDSEVYNFIIENSGVLDKTIETGNNYLFGYFSFKTLEKSYLLRINDRIAETPEMFFMRVACGIHCGDIDSVLRMYKSLSMKDYIHATPTLFNSGTKKNQLSSCFLFQMKDDSIEGIYDTLKRLALVSKFSGGVGISVNNIRSTGSFIKGTGGYSKGIMRMAKVYDESAGYVDQGGGKRNASYALFIEPWHADILSFLNMKTNTGTKKDKSLNLFSGLMIPDLIFERAVNGQMWTLFDPKSVPELTKGLIDEEFKKKYEEYERDENIKKIQIYATDLLSKIFISENETGVPYLIAKDTANDLSNQKHSGFIFNSNLCCEIMERTDSDVVSVCNLASVNLKTCIEEVSNGVHRKVFSHQKLFERVYELVFNLFKIIKRGFLPLEEASKTNKDDMPTGIGYQGFADTLIELELAWSDEEAKKLNREISETMYFAALSASNELAKRHGTYPNYNGSLISKGIFHWEMWQKRFPSYPVKLSGRWNWEELREKILLHGVANSLLIALMPTASTAQILGNNESIEPYTSNIYLRRVISGEFRVVNKKLISDLKKIGLWSEEMKNKILKYDGSIQKIVTIPERIREIYKTAYEIPMKTQIDYVADKQPFVDQAISFNHWFEEVDFDTWTSLIYYALKRGLKTLQYYHRSKPAVSADKVTLNIDNSIFKSASTSPSSAEGESCPRGCDSCGS